VIHSNSRTLLFAFVSRAKGLPNVTTDAPDLIAVPVGERARVDASEAPADETGPTAVLATDLGAASAHTPFEIVPGTQVSAQLPTVRETAEIAKKPAERSGRHLTREAARRQEKWTTVTRFQTPREGAERQRRQQLTGSATFQQQKQFRRW
jgi:hypothetical protein